MLVNHGKDAVGRSFGVAGLGAGERGEVSL